MYRELKGKLLDQLFSQVAKKLEVKQSEVMQISGLRKAESSRRNSFVDLMMLKKDKRGKVIKSLANPIFDWHIQERDLAIEILNIPRNEYADYMKHSYECQCYANLSIGERERRAIVSPEYETIDQLREKLVQTAYELQLALVQSGIWDEEDMTLHPDRLTQGWHLQKSIKPEELDNQDPFNLCQSCIGQRAFDGTGGLDIDLALNPVTQSFKGRKNVSKVRKI